MKISEILSMITAHMGLFTVLNAFTENFFEYI